MEDADYEQKLEELDRMLNDPDSKMEPEKVWSLLADVSRHDGVLAAAEPDRSSLASG